LIILFGDGQGHFVEDPGVCIEDITAHDQIGLQLKCYPNPFATSSHISISGKEKTSDGDIRIFNVRGQLVRILNFNSDVCSVEWDGKDQHNRPVSNGIYFCRYVDNLRALSAIRLIKIK
jgi:flagellar hook assembly protein FlgD